MMYKPVNCYEAYLLDVWAALSTGQQTKVKDYARESFLAMVRTQHRGMPGHVTEAFFWHIEDECHRCRR